MAEAKELTVQSEISYLPETQQAQAMLKKLQDFQKLVKTQLKKDEDYGDFGVGKLVLLKPGAEKLLTLMGYRTRIKELKEVEKDIKVRGISIPFFEYKVVVQAVNKNGDVIGEGVGNCNTLESKYCYRNGKFVTDFIHYYSIKNTIEKMAMKRAIVDLALRVGSLSNVFTQDVDDNPEEFQKPAPAPQQTQTKPVQEYSIQVEEVKKVPDTEPVQQTIELQQNSNTYSMPSPVKKYSGKKSNAKASTSSINYMLDLSRKSSKHQQLFQKLLVENAVFDFSQIPSMPQGTVSYIIDELKKL